MIQLRSGDTFQIGAVHLRIEFVQPLLPDHPPEPRCNVVDLEDIESIDQGNLSTNGRVAANSITGNEDSQDWISAKPQKATFGHTRNESRQIPYSVPPLETSAQELDRIPSSYLEVKFEDYDVGRALESYAGAQDTQNSKLRDAELLLGSGSKSQQIVSSPTANNRSDQSPNFEPNTMDAVDDDALQDSIRSTICCDIPAEQLVVTEETTMSALSATNPALTATARSAAVITHTTRETSPIVNNGGTPTETPLSRPRKRHKRIQTVTPKIDPSTRSIENSVEPSPPIGRTSRKRSVSIPMSQPIKAASYRVLFTSSTAVDSIKSHLNFLKKHGVEKVSTVEDCTVLCVGKDMELKRTGKLVLAIALGRDVIGDNWITSSFNQNRLLDPLDFFAKDDIREMEWRTSLKKAVERGKKGVRPFTGWNCNFTTTVKKDLGSGFPEIKSIAEHAGAAEVLTAPPNLGPEKLPKTVVIASPNGDKYVPALQDAGWRIFTKDIVTLSVIRGTLDVESDEFLISTSEVNHVGSKKRKR